MPPSRIGAKTSDRLTQLLGAARSVNSTDDIPVAGSTFSTSIRVCSRFRRWTYSVVPSGAHVTRAR